MIEGVLALTWFSSNVTDSSSHVKVMFLEQTGPRSLDNLNCAWMGVAVTFSKFMSGNPSSELFSLSSPEYAVKYSMTQTEGSDAGK